MIVEFSKEDIPIKRKLRAQKDAVENIKTLDKQQI